MKGVSFILFPHIIPQTIYPGQPLHLNYQKEALEQLKELKITLQGVETYAGRQFNLVNETVEYKGEDKVTCTPDCPYANFRQFPTCCLVMNVPPGLPPTCFLADATVAYILRIEGESIKGKHEPQCLPVTCVSWRMEKSHLSGRYSGMTRSTIERQPGSINLHIECLLDKSSYCFDDTIGVMFHVNNTSQEPITQILFCLVQRITFDKTNDKRRTVIQEYSFDNELPAPPGTTYKQPFNIKLPELSSELPPSVRAQNFRIEYLLEAQVKFSLESVTSPVARTLLLLLTCEGQMTEIPDRVLNALIRTTLVSFSAKRKGLFASIRGFVGSE